MSFEIVWDMSRDSLIEAECFWLLPTDDPLHPLYAIASCKHFVNGEQVPCPPMCPQQDWPRSRFRYRWWLFGKLIPREHQKEPIDR